MSDQKQQSERLTPAERWARHQAAKPVAQREREAIEAALEEAKRTDPPTDS